VVYNEKPENYALNVDLTPTLSVHIVDYQGDSVNVNFMTNVSGNWQIIGINNSILNETIYCDNTSLMNDLNTNYWWSVNATDPLGSGNWINKSYYFKTITDEPVLLNENPSDGSININRNPQLSIHVIDYQGDIVDVFFMTNSILNETIYCDNTSLISDYNTRYWWSVNATDSLGSGNWINETYSFRTKPENYIPIFSDPNPKNNTKYAFINPKISIYVADPEGDYIDVDFWTNASGYWENIGYNYSVINETVYCTNTSMINKYNTSYWWSVHATDPLGSGNWINKSYNFKTITDEPVLLNENPSDGSININLNPQLSIHVIDYQGDIVDVFFMTNTSGNWQIIGINNSILNEIVIIQV